MSEKQNKSFVMAALEGAEAWVDLITDNEAVKAVPVVSTAVRLLEGLDDIRSRILRAKLKRFLSEPSLIRSIKAQELRNVILDDNELSLSIGDTLFLVIEKVTDLQKPALLAKVFAYYLDGKLERSTFLLLAHIIDIASATDLEGFIRARGATGRNDTGWEERMVGVGLLGTVLNNPMEHVIITNHKISAVGKCFLAAIDSANSVSASAS